eukprot:snap_masked-scaffold_1-processed-gene-2.27-mRNA-1 protein AED:1.00 eAED:1.00 QI:0/0/0/0/1/1/2/0/487
MRKQKFLSRSLDSIKYLAGVQVLSKTVSFLLNQMIVRYMRDTTALGISSVQLYLLYTLGLNLTREPIRKVFLKHVQNEKYLNKLEGLWLISLVFSFLFIPILAVYFLYFAVIDFGERNDLEPEFYFSVLMVCVSIITENCFEPIVTKYELLSFGVSYLVYSMSLFVLFFIFSNVQVSFSRDMLPKEILADVRSVYIQNILKVILTEGEKIVLVSLTKVPAFILGQYALISNLGSIVARFLFAPLEQVAYSIFAAYKDEPKSIELLISFFKILSFVGLVFASFGSNYTSILIFLLYGRNFAEEPVLVHGLSIYCCYVALIAANGVLEAFVMATMTPTQLNKFNIFLIRASIFFIFISWFLLEQLGAGLNGIMLANAVNMVVRILHHTQYIFTRSTQQYSEFLVNRFFLDKSTLISFALCFICTAMSNYHLEPLQSLDRFIAHLVIGIFCFLFHSGIVFTFDKTFINNCKSLYSESQQNQVDVTDKKQQ